MRSRQSRGTGVISDKLSLEEPIINSCAGDSASSVARHKLICLASVDGKCKFDVKNRRFAVTHILAKLRRQNSQWPYGDGMVKCLAMFTGVFR